MMVHWQKRSKPWKIMSITSTPASAAHTSSTKRSQPNTMASSHKVELQERGEERTIRLNFVRFLDSTSTHLRELKLHKWHHPRSKPHKLPRKPKYHLP